MAGVLEVAQLIVGLLGQIRGEWQYCKAEDALVKKITERLYALADPIMRWAHAQEGATRGRATNAAIIASVMQDLSAIRIWLNTYREKGKKGVLARCAKMAKNVAQKAAGYTTSFQGLQEIVKDFEEKLSDMLTAATLDLSNGVDDLKQQQHQMMHELHQMSQVCGFVCVDMSVCECTCVCVFVSVCACV